MATKRETKKRRTSKKKNSNQNFFQRHWQNFKKYPLWKKILEVFLLMLLTFSLLGGIIFGCLAYKYQKDLTEINPNTFYTAKASTNVYDRNDNYIGALSLNRIRWTDLKDENGNSLVSQQYLDGLIATEDANFYSHGGVDYLGMAKAAVSTILSDNDRGGSTITMQLAKNVYMQDWVTPNEEGYDRRSQDKIGYKITQMLYAHGIERKFSKEQILENYVNVVGFGNAGYGIVNASNYFYGKAPNELTLAESATLAGMSQLPGQYNPYTNPEGTTERRNAVLGRMLKEKYITQEEYDAAINEPIDATLVSNETRPVSNEEKYQGYLDVVYQEFLKIVDPNGDNNFDVNLAGMDIYINMDADIQIGLYDIINSDDPSLYEDELIQTGAVIMDSQTGEVLAIGNGRNGHGGYFGTNFAYNYLRQPGSTSKPIVDAGPAIEYLNWSTAHPVDDKAVSYDGGPDVGNADGKFLGWMTLQESLAKSRNTTALQTFKEVSNEVGIDKIYDFVTGLGFDQIKKEDFNQAYSIGGWQYGTTPYQLAGAYGAFGNGGVYNTPHTIDHIQVNPDSQYFEKFGAEIKPEIRSERVMKESTAFMVSEMLLSTHNEASGYAPIVESMPTLSVKTGTSDWGEAGTQYGIPSGAQRDKWVAGFNANITMVTWNGYENKDEQTGHFIAYNSVYDKNNYKAIGNMVARTADAKYVSGGRLTQPENVEAKSAHVVNGEIVAGGKTHYFIKDSNDLSVEEQNPETVTDLNISPDTSANAANMSWKYPKDNHDGVTFIIQADGKEIGRTTETSFIISYKDLSSKVGCKDKYTINVISAKLIEGKEVQSSASEGKVLNFGNTNWCVPVQSSPPNNNNSNNNQQEEEDDDEKTRTRNVADILRRYRY